VREFPERLGNYLAAFVLNRLADASLAPQSVTMPIELIKRESSRPYLPTGGVSGEELSRQPLIQAATDQGQRPETVKDPL